METTNHKLLPNTRWEEKILLFKCVFFTLHPFFALSFLFASNSQKSNAAFSKPMLFFLFVCVPLQLRYTNAFIQTMSELISVLVLWLLIKYSRLSLWCSRAKEYNLHISFSIAYGSRNIHTYVYTVQIDMHQELSRFHLEFAVFTNYPAIC